MAVSSSLALQGRWVDWGPNKKRLSHSLWLTVLSLQLGSIFHPLPLVLSKACDNDCSRRGRRRSLRSSDGPIYLSLDHLSSFPHGTQGTTREAHRASSCLACISIDRLPHPHPPSLHAQPDRLEFPPPSFSALSDCPGFPILHSMNVSISCPSPEGGGGFGIVVILFLPHLSRSVYCYRSPSLVEAGSQEVECG